jgi:hypothetical protein
VVEELEHKLLGGRRCLYLELEKSGLFTQYQGQCLQTVGTVGIVVVAGFGEVAEADLGVAGIVEIGTVGVGIEVVGVAVEVVGVAAVAAIETAETAELVLADIAELAEAVEVVTAVLLYCWLQPSSIS